MYTSDVIRLPQFSIGKGIIRNLPDIVKSLGRRYAVIGGSTAMQVGLPPVEAVLSPKGFVLTQAMHFGGECTLENAERLRQELLPVDFIIGMGGGKAIDTAKLVADDAGLPLISIPTLVSNCAPITALSVVYKNGSFDEFRFYKAPPFFTAIDLEICITAPFAYFRAGMGDAMAKYLESTFSAQGDILGDSLDHMSYMGILLSKSCWEPIRNFGVQALEDWKAGHISNAVDMVSRSIIISAGLVSLLAHDQYNCALAHSVCYGLQLFPHIEKECLHGDLVAYGILVQLCMEERWEDANDLLHFLTSIGTKVKLAEMNVPLDPDALEKTLSEAVSGPDMEHVPYPVTKDMVFSAMVQAESLT